MKSKRQKPNNIKTRAQNGTFKDWQKKREKHNNINNLEIKPEASYPLKKIGPSNKTDKNIGIDSKLLWKASDKTKHHNRPSLDTGFAALNHLLAQRGWPLDGITELGLKNDGIGEIRLLLPALLRRSQYPIIFIAPPFLPYAPALEQFGLAPSHCLILKPSSLADTLWAAEQCLLADTSSNVLCWTGAHSLQTKAIRRLELAVKKRQHWFVLLRQDSRLDEASNASLRMHVDLDRFGQLSLKVIKQTGSWGGQQCTLSLAPHYEQWQRLAVSLWPQTNHQQTRATNEGNDNKNDNSKNAINTSANAAVTNTKAATKTQNPSTLEKSLWQNQHKANVTILSTVAELQTVY